MIDAITQQKQQIGNTITGKCDSDNEDAKIENNDNNDTIECMVIHAKSIQGLFMANTFTVREFTKKCLRDINTDNCKMLFTEYASLVDAGIFSFPCFICFELFV